MDDAEFTGPATREGLPSLPLDPLVGDHVLLRPLTPHDYAAFFAIEQDPNHRVWPLPASATVAPANYETVVWEGVSAQFAIIANDDGSLVGRAAAVDMDLVNGSARVLFSVRAGVAAEAWPGEAAEMFVAHVFERWRLHKVYWEYADRLGSAVVLPSHGILADFREEGRLTGHVWDGAGRADLVITAMTREAWGRR